MNCAWDLYLSLLPNWMRQSVDKQGRETLLELRLRQGLPPELVFSQGSAYLDRTVSKLDLEGCINFASRFSPWTAATATRGYITAPGGHRIGICGSYIHDNASNSYILQSPGMLCLRVARDFQGIAPDHKKIPGSVLIIGKPGSGKTTLMRDLIRRRSNEGRGTVSVVDEREELFPISGGCYCFPPGRRTDVISGCKKPDGVEMVLRNMTPAVIALDEITAQEDCDALLHAGWCGVDLYATAHAGSSDDLYSRPIYRPVIRSGLFSHLVILRGDKSWYTERMKI